MHGGMFFDRAEGLARERARAGARMMRARDTRTRAYTWARACACAHAQTQAQARRRAGQLEEVYGGGGRHDRRPTGFSVSC